MSNNSNSILTSNNNNSSIHTGGSDGIGDGGIGIGGIGIDMNASSTCNNINNTSLSHAKTQEEEVQGSRKRERTEEENDIDCQDANIRVSDMDSDSMENRDASPMNIDDVVDMDMNGQQDEADQQQQQKQKHSRVDMNVHEQQHQPQHQHQNHQQQNVDAEYISKEYITSGTVSTSNNNNIQVPFPPFVHDYDGDHDESTTTWNEMTTKDNLFKSSDTKKTSRASNSNLTMLNFPLTPSTKRRSPYRSPTLHVKSVVGDSPWMRSRRSLVDFDNGNHNDDEGDGEGGNGDDELEDNNNEDGEDDLMKGLFDFELYEDMEERYDDDEEDGDKEMLRDDDEYSTYEKELRNRKGDDNRDGLSIKRNQGVEGEEGEGEEEDPLDAGLRYSREYYAARGIHRKIDGGNSLPGAEEKHVSSQSGCFKPDSDSFERLSSREIDSRRKSLSSGDSGNLEGGGRRSRVGSGRD
ncbi:hypothetical protein HDU76_004164, partial [Blyttiomyces sp. JEL0837]